MDLPKSHLLQHEYAGAGSQRFGNQFDFIRVLQSLYKHRWLMLAITCAAGFLAWAASFLVTPVYQIKTNVVAPQLYMYENLLHNSGISIDGSALFKLFLKKLERRGNVVDYLVTSGIAEKTFGEKGITTPEAKARLLNQLADSYRVSVIRKNNKESKVKNKEVMKDNSLEADLITTSATLSLDAAKNIGYLAYTNTQVLDELVRDRKVMAKLAIDKLQRKIDSDLALIRKKRENQVILLKDKRATQLASLNDAVVAMTIRDTKDQQLELEDLQNALVIAKRLGIENGYDRSPRLSDKAVVIDINNKNHADELYLKGTKYLEKRIQIVEARKQSLAHSRKIAAIQEKLYKINNDRNILALEKRVDDEPYTKGIIEKTAAIAELEKLTFNTNQVQAYQMAGAPEIDTRPVSPNHMIYAIAGLLAGFMLAVALAVVVDARVLFAHYYPEGGDC